MRTIEVSRVAIPATMAGLLFLVATAPAQLQFDELGKRHLPPAPGAHAVALGDVDSDGDHDLVLGSSQNRLYLNDGSGIFADVTEKRMPPGSGDCATLGDVDGDGDLDLVFGNHGQNQLCLNDGSGAFTDATASRLPVDNDDTEAVEFGDVDRDGDLDLVIANSGDVLGAQNRLYLNDGTGTFTDVTSTHMPLVSQNTLAVALGDVDGDGDADLVFGCWYFVDEYGSEFGGPNLLYLNDGMGVFTDTSSSRLPRDYVRTNAVALGDVDSDGDVDIVFGNEGDGGYALGQNRLYVNGGTGTFTDATSSRLPADDDDTVAVVLGDVDGDGDSDLVFGNQYPQNRLYLNDGSGTFGDATAAGMPPDHTALAVALGEVDGDGDPDLVLGQTTPGSPSRENRLYLNSGSGTFTDTTPAHMPPDRQNALAVALDDVDGDGDPDLVFGELGQNGLFLNDGTGTYTDATASRLPTDSDDTRAVALGDVDGDGDLDLVWGNHFRHQNRLYLNGGAGTFTDATVSHMPVDGDNTRAVALSDVDGDGDLDLLIGNVGQNRLYLNGGSGHFADATARMPSYLDPTTALVTGDVDADGDADLVIANGFDLSGRLQNRLYLNGGNGWFTDGTAARMPVDLSYTNAMALGDVDGDGDPDLVLANFGQDRIYLNEGHYSGIFTDATATSMPVDNDGTNAVALGDVDGDGDADLVFGNSRFGSEPRQNRLYLNNGTGTYTDATASRLPVSADTLSLALADVDLDGDVDLVCGTDIYSPIRLYLNLRGHLDAPFLARIGHPYQLDVYARYGPTGTLKMAVPFISAGTASIPLPPLGTLGLDPAQMIGMPAFIITQPDGLGSLSFTVPNLPGLVGASVYAQAVIVHYPVEHRLSNWTADDIMQ